MSAQDPYDSLVPIFLRTEVPKRTTQIATAIFVEIHGEPFLLTAAHVTDHSCDGELLIPTPEGLRPIEGYKAFIDILPEMRRSEDTTDIAYYRLSSSYARSLVRVFRPLRQLRTRIVMSAHEYDVYSVTGYPATKARRNEEKFMSEIYSFRGMVANQLIYDHLGLSPQDSIVVHFQRDRAIDTNEFLPMPTPAMNGVSGGGMFAWPRGQELLTDWSLPLLVGIFHTYKQREGLLIGTTLLSVLTAISLGRIKGYGGIE